MDSLSIPGVCVVEITETRTLPGNVKLLFGKRKPIRLLKSIKFNRSVAFDGDQSNLTCFRPGKFISQNWLLMSLNK